MNMYEILRKVFISLDMINSNYANNYPIVELQNIPSFAKQSILKTITLNGYSETAEVVKIINAGTENDTVFIALMANADWPTTVDSVLTPKGERSFVITIPEKLFVDIESDEAAPIIYHIFADIAQYDSNLMYNIDAQLINSYASESGMFVPTYDLVIGSFVIYLANHLIKSWWPDLINDFHEDMTAFLSSIDYDIVVLTSILKKAFGNDSSLNDFVNVVKL